MPRLLPGWRGDSLASGIREVPFPLAKSEQ